MYPHCRGTLKCLPAGFGPSAQSCSSAGSPRPQRPRSYRSHWSPCPRLWWGRRVEKRSEGVHWKKGFLLCSLNILLFLSIRQVRFEAKLWPACVRLPQCSSLLCRRWAHTGRSPLHIQTFVSEQKKVRIGLQILHDWLGPQAVFLNWWFCCKAVLIGQLPNCKGSQSSRSSWTRKKLN